MGEKGSREEKSRGWVLGVALASTSAADPQALRTQAWHCLSCGTTNSQPGTQGQPLAPLGKGLQWPTDQVACQGSGRSRAWDPSGGPCPDCLVHNEDG